MMKQKGKWLAAATSLVAFTSTLQAADDAQMRNYENRVSALEARKGSGGQIMPAVNPRLKAGTVDLFVQGSVLFMQAREDNLEFVSNGLTTGAQVAYIHPSAKWNWGFRAGVGYNLPYDGWDVQLNWMYIQNKMDKSFTAALPASAYPLLDPSSVASLSQNATSANWWGKFSIVDCDLGRDFYVAKMMTLNPYVGMRSAWIRQSYSLLYNTTYVLHTNNYWGLGIHTGLNMDFMMGMGLSIFGNFGYSLTYGNFHTDDSDITNTQGINNESRNTKQIMDFMMGLRYRNTTMANDVLGIEVDLGWEYHSYDGQNQIRGFTNPTASSIGSNSNGDLSQRGWSMKIRFDF